MKNRLKNAVYMVCAFFFLFLGMIGVVIPLLPTTPFLLTAAFFFAKGSQRFNRWFLSTRLYQNHLEEFLKTRAMTRQKKLWIVIPVSLMLFVTAALAQKTILRVVIFVLVMVIYYYFAFRIKTIRE